jgi:hypothetical protein
MLVIPVLLSGACSEPRSRAVVNGGGTAEHPSGVSILLTEDFESPANTDWGTLPPHWWLEGTEGGATARIEAGRLLVDATRTPGSGCTVWLDRELPEGVEISFDVHVIDAIELANNMNLMVDYRDPLGDRLRDSREERGEGTYALYHEGRLEGTIVTYVANGDPDSARVRVRRVPPLDPIVQEYRGYHARAGHTYHFVLEHRGDRLALQVDGMQILDTTLPPKLSTAGGGYLGFRTWNTKLWWDNLRIRELRNGEPH